MKQKTKEILFDAWVNCDNEDKSTEFMIAYMSDVAQVSEECVVNFLLKTTEEERDKWYKKKALYQNCTKKKESKNENSRANI